MAGKLNQDANAVAAASRCRPDLSFTPTFGEARAIAGFEN
jgi:hypothetical protein